MPKATRKSNRVSNTHSSEGQAMFNHNEGQEEFNHEQETVSGNESQEEYNNSNASQENLDATYESSSDQEVEFNPKPTSSKKVHHSRKRSVQVTTQQQAYMPYIEGPAMDWTVNDGLYSRFLKWKLRCENILECELAMLSEDRKCKKVIAWSGDFGLDQYISWNLTKEELCLDTIWQKYEEFCKPQANELRARFDLLTSFKQDQMSVDEWYNKVQTQIGLCNYPPETAQILQRDIFWFFLSNESFISKTLDEGHVSLKNFPASRVRQMAKKLEGSQATAKHIKQVTNEPHATQINLLRHQRTELPPTKSQRKQNKRFKQRQPPNKKFSEEQYRNRKPQRSYSNSQGHTNTENRCTKCGDSPHIQGFRCPASRHQCKYCHKYRHFSKLCFKKNGPEHKQNTRRPKAHQLMVGTASTIEDQSYASYSSSEDSFCLQLQAKSTKERYKKDKPQHLATNIEYKLKPHRRRTRFLRARIDTCSNVNLLPISVYKLMYKDPECTKLEPSNKVAVKTYTTEKIKIVGSCKMFIVQPQTKVLQEVTFHVTSHEGSVILSCATSIKLGLIYPHTKLDEMPEEGSLIYSKADMPKKQRNKSCQAENNMCSKKPKSQVQRSYDKNCQADKSNVMRSVTNTEDMHLTKPAIRRLCRDKNCQSTRCYRSPRRPKYDKNCQ